MRKFLSIVLTGVLVSFTVGCMAFDVVPVSLYESDYPHVPTDSVRVFRDARSPDNASDEYVRIAQLRGSGKGSELGDPGAEHVIQELRKKAGELGANAVYVLSSTEKVAPKPCPSRERTGDVVRDAVGGIAAAMRCDQGRGARAEVFAVRFLP